jgi:hypothetical protein
MNADMENMDLMITAMPVIIGHQTHIMMKLEAVIGHVMQDILREMVIVNTILRHVT